MSYCLKCRKNTESKKPKDIIHLSLLLNLFFTNFIKNGENSIIVATIVGKFPLSLICLLETLKCFNSEN